MAVIYALVDDQDRPVYVGNTTQRHISQRMSQHAYSARVSRSGNSRLHDWVRAQDGPPRYKVLAEVDDVDRYRSEAFHTLRLIGEGYELFNIRKGGGGFVTSDETKRKLSQANKGRKLPFRARKKAIV